MLRLHPRRVLALLAFAIVSAASAALPAAAFAVPPVNDNYLSSLPVNQRATQLTQEQVKDLRDTREATVQADLFAPPATGGGPERTECQGTNYGATVWYDFHPHVNGTVRIATAGYDAVVSVYEFAPPPANPTITRRVDCVNQAGTTEELFVEVKRGASYTIQIGGVDAGAGPATGMLDFTFEYLQDTDADTVLDPLDRCPTQAGSRDAAGCPPQLNPTVTLRAVPTGNGVQVRSLLVNAPRGSSVRVRCRRGCVFSQTRRALRVVGFPRLRNRRLPAGAWLEIYVTQPRAIGRYIRYTITRGNFRRTTRCLRPGSMTPLRRCR